MRVHPSSQGSRLGAGPSLARLADEAQDGIGECLSARGAAFLRDEPWEALRGPRGLQGLKGAPGDAQVCGRLGPGVTVSCDTPAPLLLHLERVIRVKQGIGRAQVVSHLLRRRVEGAGSQPLFPFATQRGSRLFQGRCPRDDAR